MIGSFDEIEKELRKIDSGLSSEIKLYIFGGAALLFQGLKPATKDIDAAVSSTEEFKSLKKCLVGLGYDPIKPDIFYNRLEIDQILTKDDFRIDLFDKMICGKFSLSKPMISRSKKILDLSNLKVYLCSNEDIFLLKTMTEREGDIEDCISLSQSGLDWKEILSELQVQVKISGQKVWITWVGERLEVLEEKGLNIPIMKDVHKMVEEYYLGLEKK